MCYSVESSAKTTLYSLITIIILLRSGVPHFQWLGVILIGWCGMQFDELLLWLTNPRKGCTPINKLITVTLIPLVLILQPLGSIIGSFFVKPWNQSSQTRKLFIVLYSVMIIVTMLYMFFSNRHTLCANVTPNGHLNWWLNKKYVFSSELFYFLWGIGILLPLLLLWNASYKLIFVITLLPLFGYNYGITTDSKASIWCYYTSFTSIVSLIAYGLFKFNIYNILK
jgi:hypothetical protein